MVENRPDWCLSRQRAWGVPIPSIRSKASGKSVLDPRFIDAFIRVVAEKGTDAWFTDPLESFWPEGFVHEPTGERSPADFDKEFDILDVWFDSGSTHLACLETNPKLSWPADLYLEGSDQHRGWFQSSLLVGVAARGSAPFKAVLTHGFVLDGKGKAMSKSAGNVISPLDLMKQLGADIIRLWVCSEDYRGDVRVSREILERVGEAYRRIRNALRFLIGNLHDFDAARDRVAPERLEEIDRWILSRLANLVEQVDRAYANYEFHRVYHLVHGFCVFELSAVYLDVVKDRLYCSAANDATRRAAQTALDELFGALVRLVAPILVFTADEAWEFAGGEGESVHLSDMPIPAAGRRDRELEAKWDSLLELREEAAIALEEARRAKTIGHSLDAAVQIAPADREESEFLSANLSLLKTLLIVSHLRVGPKSQPTAAAPQPGEGSDALSEGGAASRWRVAPAQGEKCERCWMKDPLVGRDVEHPTLCSRCCEVMRTLESEGFPHKQGR
jgi:isoleucyl-tRNA synthetase